MRRTRQLFLLVLLFVALYGFSQESVHVLQRGETLYTLARRYGVSADTLVQYNGIEDPTRLPIGAQIRIPGTYTVSDGEYIYSIARKLGVGWLDLLEANGLDRDDVVRPGDVLFVPGGATAQTGDPVTVAADTGSDSTNDTSNDSTDAVTDSTGGTTTESGTATVPPAQSEDLHWPHPGDREDYDGRLRGVAIDGQAGDTFWSVTSGVVSLVGPFTSFGKLILVRAENGYLYGYAGADRVDVQQGDRIDNGTVLGSLGVSPAFQSARVLFTVWRDGRYIDPERAPRG